MTKDTLTSDKHSIEVFESAALPHLDDLFRTARRVLGNRSEAEDVVQETYLQAWKSFERFEPGTNCRAWLYKIMFHVIQHHRRKRFSTNLRSVQDDNVDLETALVYEPPIPQELTDAEVIAAIRANHLKANIGGYENAHFDMENVTIHWERAWVARGGTVFGKGPYLKVPITRRGYRSFQDDEIVIRVYPPERLRKKLAREWSGGNLT